MATHSSILAWRIPLTEEPGGLQSVLLITGRVNFVCQLDWAMGCPNIWSNIESGCVCEGISDRSKANWGFPGGSVSNESTCSVGDLGSIPGLRKCPGGEHGNPFQYSRLENSMDRGAW